MMYKEGETFEQFKTAGEAFTPMFEPIFADDATEARAVELCGDNLQCKFDFAATNDEDVAGATLEEANNVDNTNTNLGK